MNIQNRLSSTFADKPPMPMHSSFSHSSLGGLVGKRVATQRKAQRVMSGHQRLRRNYGGVSISQVQDGEPPIRADSQLAGRQSTDGGGLRHKFKSMLKTQVVSASGPRQVLNLKNARQLDKYVDQATGSGARVAVTGKRPKAHGSLGGQPPLENERALAIQTAYGGQPQPEANTLRFAEESAEAGQHDNYGATMGQAKSNTLSFTQINITSTTKGAQFVHQSSTQTLASAQGAYSNAAPGKLPRRAIVRPTTAKIPSQSRGLKSFGRPPSDHPTLYRGKATGANYASSNLTQQPSTQPSAKAKGHTRHAQARLLRAPEPGMSLPDGLADIREEQVKSAEYLQKEGSGSPARKSLKKLASNARQRPKTALQHRRELARNPSSKITKMDS